MNLNLFSHRDRWLMVDCGVTFDDQRLDQRGRPSVVTPTGLCLMPQFAGSLDRDRAGITLGIPTGNYVSFTRGLRNVLRKKSAWRRSVRQHR